MQYGDVIIFDNETGQCMNLPHEQVLLKWNEQIERLFPVDGTYWAVGVVRRATNIEKQTVRWGNQSK